MEQANTSDVKHEPQSFNDEAKELADLLDKVQSRKCKDQDSEPGEPISLEGKSEASLDLGSFESVCMRREDKEPKTTRNSNNHPLISDRPKRQNSGSITVKKTSHLLGNKLQLTSNRQKYDQTGSQALKSLKAAD